MGYIPPQMQNPNTPPPPPIPPQPPQTPDSKKKAAQDLLHNLTHGKEPVGKVKPPKTAGHPPVPGTGVADHVDKQSDPTQDYTNAYYGVSPGTLAANDAATRRAQAAEQAMSTISSVATPPAPTYTAPQEDHPGRKNLEQLAPLFLAAIMGSGRRNAGTANFLAALSGSMGQKRQADQTNAANAAKEKFTSANDTWKEGITAHDSQLKGAQTVYDAANKEADAMQAKVDKEHQTALDEYNKKVEQAKKDAEWAADHKISVGKFNLELAKAKNTQADAAQRLAYQHLTVENELLNGQTMRAATQARLALEARNQEISQSRLGLEGERLDLDKKRVANEMTPAERTKNTIESRQITEDSKVLSAIPGQIKSDVTSLYKATFESPQAKADIAADPTAKAKYQEQFNHGVQAIYSNYGRTISSIHSRMRTYGIDTSDMEGDISSAAQGAAGALGDPETLPNLPAEAPPELHKAAHDAAVSSPPSSPNAGGPPPASAPPATAPPAQEHAAPAGMKLVGHMPGGKPVYQSADGKYHY